MKIANWSRQRICLVLAPVLLLIGFGVNAETVSSNDVDPDVRSSLLSIAGQWLNAWNEQDLDQMMSLHAPDLVYYWRGRPRGYETFIYEIREYVFHETKSSTVALVDPQIQILSSEIGIIGFQLGDSRATVKAEPGAAVSLVIARRDNDWKIIHIHESPVR